MIFRRVGARPLVVGHRGVRYDGAPAENTMAAFEQAVKDGADAIELDARLTLTGEVACVHDPDLARVSKDRDVRAIAATPWRRLAEVELEGGARIPSLTDVLAFAAEAGIAVNVEMKRDLPDRKALVRAVASILRDDVATIVSSFDPAMLLQLARLSPRTPRALLVHPSGNERAALAAAYALGPNAGAHALHLAQKIATPARVRRLQRRGFVIGVWTVNEEDEMKRFSDLAVDLLITDRPKLARRALG